MIAPREVFSYAYAENFIYYLLLHEHQSNIYLFQMTRYHPCGTLYWRLRLKTQYCQLSTACYENPAAIFVMLKIRAIRLFAAQIELKNNRRLALVKTKTTTVAREA